MNYNHLNYINYFLKKASRLALRKVRTMNQGFKRQIKNIAICLPQVIFSKGGAEDLVDSLTIELKKRSFNVDIIKLPYTWYPECKLKDSINFWNTTNLNNACNRDIDLVITTKFPSYYVHHKNKVLWLIHQFRQVYDLFDTNYSEYSSISKSDLKLKEWITSLDSAAFSEHRKCFTISKNTANRMKLYNSVNAQPLYHPPKLFGKYYNSFYGDYIFSAGRLEKIKRIDLLIKSLSFTDNSIKCKIAGTGPYEIELKKLVNDLGLSHRVEFLGYVKDDQLLKLYSECFGVYFSPYDEDYGYITLEAFLSKKPVITANDSGGPLEFIQDGKNGFVFNSKDIQQLSSKISTLYEAKENCSIFGNSGYDSVKNITWDDVINKLVS